MGAWTLKGCLRGPDRPLSTAVSFLRFPSDSISLWSVFLVLLRISRLFSDVKKILLYSQNDKNLEGFKELSQALQLLQDSRSGRRRVPSACEET